MAGFLTFIGAHGGGFAATSTFTALGGGLNQTSATEAEMQTTTHQAGVWSKLQAYVVTNLSASVVLRFRVNGANGNQILSPGSGTGYFEDASNTDTVADGDEIAVAYTAGSANSVIVSVLAGLFTATSGYAVRVGANSSAGASFTAAATDNFLGFSQAISVGTAETARDTTVECACTLKNLYVYVKSNLRTTTTTIRSRKNGADGNLLVSVTTLATGVFEDASNTDSLAAGDTANFVLRTAAADTLALVINGVFADLYSATAALPYVQSPSNSYLANVTYYTSIGGSLMNRSTTEVNNQLKAEQAGTLSGLAVKVTANTITATTTIRSRINGANGNLLLSIGSGATGVFTDLSNSDTIAATDMLSYMYTIGATGTSITTRQGSVVFTPAVVGGVIFRKQNFTMTQAVHRAAFW